MLIQEIKNVVDSCNKKEIKKFSLTIGIFLLVVGLFLLWKNINWYIYIILTGGMILISGIFFTIILKPLYIFWMSFAVILGFIMTRIILTVIYCVFFIPAGVIIRILRKDPLKEKFDHNADSYWIRRNINKFDPKSVERQF